jgi:hypothetical protein
MTHVTPFFFFFLRFRIRHFFRVSYVASRYTKGSPPALRRHENTFFFLASLTSFFLLLLPVRVLSAQPSSLVSLSQFL